MSDIQRFYQLQDALETNALFAGKLYNEHPVGYAHNSKLHRLLQLDIERRVIISEINKLPKQMSA